jgi:hypothetical protein
MEVAGPVEPVAGSGENPKGEIMLGPITEILRQSAAQIATDIANFLPRLLALVVVLVFGTLLAWLIGAILRRSLRKMELDSHLDEWGFSGLAQWSPEKSPSLLFVRIASWTVFLLSMLIAGSLLFPALISDVLARAFSFVPNFIAAILVLLVGIVLARFLAQGVLISAVNLQIHSARLISLGVKWLVMVMAGAMAFEHLGIGGGIILVSFSILFGGIVLALALAIGLGSKDMVSRSWERQTTESDERAEEPFPHL